MPPKINLREEAGLLGVNIVTDIGEAQPRNEPVFLGYQRRWFEDESQICIAEKSRRTGLTWAEAGRNVMTAAKPKRRGGRNVFMWVPVRKWRWNTSPPAPCLPAPLTSWQRLTYGSRPSGTATKRRNPHLHDPLSEQRI